MKRFYLFCLLVLTSIPMQAKNKISMVTYFPVPYVAYSQVNTTEQMDIGLTSTCDMKLGCSETSATLNATQVNLNGGKLNLDGGRGIKGYTVSLGNGSGEGRISFQNVRIQTGAMESVNAQDTQVANLNLFGKTFPSCKSANSESGGQMQWTSLKLKGASSNELYLACGNLGESEEPEECQPYNGQSYQEKCPYSEDYLTYTWDKNNCEYIKSGVCKTRYLTGYQCQWAVDICEGGESFTRHYGSILNLAGCGNGGTSITDDHFIAHGEYPSSVAGWVEYNFKFLASGPYNDSRWYLDCEVGRPCPSCEVGKKYIYRSLESHPGVVQACFSYGGCSSYSGSYAVSALVSYAECRETTEDWTDLTDRDGSLLSEQLCDPYTWRRD